MKIPAHWSLLYVSSLWNFSSSLTWWPRHRIEQQTERERERRGEKKMVWNQNINKINITNKSRVALVKLKLGDHGGEYEGVRDSNGQGNK